MAMWKRAMDYLGLGPDDAYDDYGYDDEDDYSRPSRGSDFESRPSRAPREDHGGEGVV
ncbi:MAG: hypothetical protein RLZZ01_683, partial [Actinomycetota bacterium]